jgi:oligosaccharide reducing-end xylanase
MKNKKDFYRSCIVMLLITTTFSSNSVFAQAIKDTKKAFENIKYRNLFLEAGYKKEAIDKKLSKAYYDVFEGPNKVYFTVGDTMAYVSDVKNKDARTEGMSYGMMVAVQLNKKEVFDKIWRFSKAYLQHQS